MTDVLFSPEKFAEGLALELLNQDPRIKVCSLYGEVDDDAGYLPTKKQIIFPAQLPTAGHQIAHMVEMKSPFRWTMIDWGMKSGIDTIKTRQFFAYLSREVRVRAIQLHIENNGSIDKSSSTYCIFNNSYWFKAATERLPFGRFSSIAQVYDWVNDLRDRTYNAWNVERIRHEWSIRLNHIQHWMETKEVISN